ncbi:metalloregulator ArsR/SmtB family transcription factor [Glutamicibacter endophyticus]
MQDLNRPLYEVKAGLFKGLSHPLRIRILEVLSTGDEVPVSELIKQTGLEASHLSQHLAVLRKNRLVDAERRGSQVFYKIAYRQVTDLLHVARALLGEILASTRQQLSEQGDLPPISVAPMRGGEA